MSGETKGSRDRVSPPLKKRFGQHHLVQGSLCTPLVDYLDPRRRRVLEIGPGGGVLTRQLLAAGARVMVVEIDLSWAGELSRRLSALSIFVGDATEVEWSRLPEETLVAGNLPFNVGTALIEQLLPMWQRIPRMAFLLQREVGDRLLAVPGDGAYGALSVLTTARARVTRLGRVARGSFRPPPKVDGVFVGFALHEPPLAETEMVGFTAMVRLAFSQRRKQLRNSLASGWGREPAAAALELAGIDPRARAEEISLERFLRLYEVRRELNPPR